MEHLKNNNLSNFKGGYVKTSLNLRPNEVNFLKQTGYSVTAIFRKALNDLMNNKLHEDVNEMATKIERLSKLINQQAQFLEDKGLSEQFGSFQDKSEENELKRNKAEKEADEVLNQIK